MHTTVIGATSVLTPAPREPWRQLLDHDPSALVSQTPEWIDAMVATGGFVDASRLYELGDGRRFVLPLVRRAHWPTRAAPASSFSNGWGIGGLVGPDADAGAVGAVISDLARENRTSVAIRPNPLHGHLWPGRSGGGTVVIPRRAHVVALPGDADEAWAQFRQRTRRGVRAAEKAGVTVEVDDRGALMPVLYDLTVRAVERWAEQQREPLALARFRHRRRDPLEKLQAIAHHLGPSCRVYVARLDGRPVAAHLLLVGRTAHRTRAAVDPELGRESRAGFLLEWAGIRDAIDAGCGAYHLGESGDNDGLAMYKEGFGAQAYEYPEVRLERLPLTRTDRLARGAVKRLIGFRDV